jgi:hypothetical protein
MGQQFSQPGGSSNVVIYYDCSYSGASVGLALGNYANIPGPVGNRQMSSITIPAGITVILYEQPNYGGQVWQINGPVNVSCFASNYPGAQGGWWNDRASSMKIMTIPSPPPPPTSVGGCELIYNYDFPYNDIKNGPSSSLADCAQQCQSTPGCNGFARANSNGWCWLKTGLANQNSNTDRTCGKCTTPCGVQSVPVNVPYGIGDVKVATCQQYTQNSSDYQVTYSAQDGGRRGQAKQDGGAVQVKVTNAVPLCSMSASYNLDYGLGTKTLQRCTNQTFNTETGSVTVAIAKTGNVTYSNVQSYGTLIKSEKRQLLLNTRYFFITSPYYNRQVSARGGGNVSVIQNRLGWEQWKMVAGPMSQVYFENNTFSGQYLSCGADGTITTSSTKNDQSAWVLVKSIGQYTTATDQYILRSVAFPLVLSTQPQTLKLNNLPSTPQGVTFNPSAFDQMVWDIAPYDQLRFVWSNSGIVGGLMGLKITNPSTTATLGNTWNQTYLCYSHEIGMIWAENNDAKNQLVNSGNYKVTQITEGAEPATNQWMNKWLCVPAQSFVDLQWTSSDGGRDQLISQGYQIVKWEVPGDPYTWADNYLGYKWLSQTYESQQTLSYILDLQAGGQNSGWCSKQPIGSNCFQAIVNYKSIMSRNGTPMTQSGRGLNLCTFDQEINSLVRQSFDTYAVPQDSDNFITVTKNALSDSNTRLIIIGSTDEATNSLSNSVRDFMATNLCANYFSKLEFRGSYLLVFDKSQVKGKQVIYEAMNNCQMVTFKSKCDLFCTPIFNPVWYVNKYPDLKAAFGDPTLASTQQKARDHWTTYGSVKEGRQASATFAVRDYISLYPDVQQCCGQSFPQAIQHYLTTGLSQGRIGVIFTPTYNKYKILSNYLQCYLDSRQPDSYPGTGLVWKDLSGNNRNFNWNTAPQFDDGRFKYIGASQAKGPASNSFTTPESQQPQAVVVANSPAPITNVKYTSNGSWPYNATTSSQCLPTNAELNHENAWCAAQLKQSTNYIQADFGKVYNLSQVITQGRTDVDQWVTKFVIYYHTSSGAWVQNGSAQLVGNSDRDTQKINTVSIETDSVRIYPMEWYNYASMRVGFVGQAKPQAPISFSGDQGMTVVFASRQRTLPTVTTYTVGSTALPSSGVIVDDASNIQFIDLNSRIKSSGTITSWALQISRTGPTNLQIFRPLNINQTLDGTYTLIYQSDVINFAKTGLQTLNNLNIAVNAGDYIGWRYPTSGIGTISTVFTTSTGNVRWNYSNSPGVGGTITFSPATGSGPRIYYYQVTIQSSNPPIAFSFAQQGGAPASSDQGFEAVMPSNTTVSSLVNMGGNTISVDIGPKWNQTCLWAYVRTASGQLQIYCNGNLLAASTDVATALNFSTTPVTINQSNWNADIAMFAVYNYGLLPQHIKLVSDWWIQSESDRKKLRDSKMGEIVKTQIQGFPVPVGLQCYLDANYMQSYPGKGTTFTDMGPYKRNFTFQTQPKFENNSIATTGGNALTGPASNSFNIDEADNYSIVWYAKTNSMSQNSVFEFYGNCPYDRGIFCHPTWSDTNNPTLYFDQMGCCDETLRLTASTSGKWNKFTVYGIVRDNNGRHIYMNGAKVATTPDRGQILNLNQRPLSLLVTEWYQTWNCNFGAFMVFNNGLTGQNMVDLYSWLVSAYEFGEYSWDQANQYCINQGQQLCTYNEYCPKGAMQSPLYKLPAYDMWAPVLDSQNQWVEVGDPTRLCKLHTDVCKGPNQYCGTDNKPLWGPQPNTGRRAVLCCNPPKIQVYFDTIGQIGPETVLMFKNNTYMKYNINTHLSNDIVTTDNWKLSGIFKEGKFQACLDYQSQNLLYIFKESLLIQYNYVTNTASQPMSISSVYSGLSLSYQTGEFDALLRLNPAQFAIFRGPQVVIYNESTQTASDPVNINTYWPGLSSIFTSGHITAIIIPAPNQIGLFKEDLYAVYRNGQLQTPQNTVPAWRGLKIPFIKPSQECLIYNAQLSYLNSIVSNPSNKGDIALIDEINKHIGVYKLLMNKRCNFIAYSDYLKDLRAKKVKIVAMKTKIANSLASIAEKRAQIADINKQIANIDQEITAIEFQINIQKQRVCPIDAICNTDNVATSPFDNRLCSNQDIVTLLENSGISADELKKVQPYLDYQPGIGNFAIKTHPEFYKYSKVKEVALCDKLVRQQPTTTNTTSTSAIDFVGQFYKKAPPIGPSSGQPLGPNGQPLGPNGQPLGPNGQPLGPNGKPLGPNGKPLGPNGQPLGPNGNSSNPSTAQELALQKQALEIFRKAMNQYQLELQQNLQKHNQNLQPWINQSKSVAQQLGLNATPNQLKLCAVNLQLFANLQKSQKLSFETDQIMNNILNNSKYRQILSEINDLKCHLTFKKSQQAQQGAKYENAQKTPNMLDKINEIIKQNQLLTGEINSIEKMLNDKVAILQQFAKRQ